METATITKGKRTRYYHTPPKYKYAVFAGESFYPAGGFDDFYGYATNYVEALQMYNEAKTTGSNRSEVSWWGKSNRCNIGECDWAHVVNLKKHKIVFK